MIDQAAIFLTGEMARIFSHRRVDIHTFPEYLEWLEFAFNYRNEQSKLRDEWHSLVQGSNLVHEYVSELTYLAARIIPTKGLEELKEHFRAGLNSAIQIRMAEHPEWDSLPIITVVKASGAHKSETADISTYDGLDQDKGSVARSCSFVAGINSTLRYSKQPISISKICAPTTICKLATPPVQHDIRRALVQFLFLFLLLNVSSHCYVSIPESVQTPKRVCGYSRAERHLLRLRI